MAGPWSPDRGDIVWLHFDPQAGRRPSLVVSSRAFNRTSGLAVVCPIRSRVKGYPFEVELPAGMEVGGAVLCDQVKSLDWKARRAARAGRAPESVVEDVTAKLIALVQPES